MITPWEGEIWVSEPPFCSDAAYWQIALALIISCDCVYGIDVIVIVSMLLLHETVLG